MSEATRSPGLWLREESREASRKRLHFTVAALARARRLQVLVDHAFAGLLVGLCLATLVVLAARLGGLPLPLGKASLAIVAVALAVALALAAWRRPDNLQVAIRADLALRLKQRLSTAWELISVDGDSELSDRLAMHAVKAGLPARAASVFPLRVNRWGRLAPLAATALLLVSVVEIERLQAPAPAQDERVVNEGERLGAFGREMRSRAEREALPRSERQGTQLERLGGRMESGALSRSEALEQLRQMAESIERGRAQALAERGADLQPGAAGRHAGAVGRDASGVPQPSQRAAPGRDAAGALGQRLDDLERAGIPRRAVERALERNRIRADEPLDELLEKLAPIERALREDEEMRRALEAVRRSQDALGSPRASSSAAREGASIDWDEDESGQPGVRAGASTTDQNASGEQLALQMPRTGSQGDARAASAEPRTALPPKPAPEGPVLTAPGQPREGDSFSTEARILPRTNRPTAHSAPLSAEFEAQVEAVLANEQYPDHYKEFVRRYFLTLSQGERKGRRP